MMNSEQNVNSNVNSNLPFKQSSAAAIKATLYDLSQTR